MADLGAPLAALLAKSFAGICRVVAKARGFAFGWLRILQVDRVMQFVCAFRVALRLVLEDA